MFDVLVTSILNNANVIHATYLKMIENQRQR